MRPAHAERRRQAGFVVGNAHALVIERALSWFNAAASILTDVKLLRSVAAALFAAAFAAFLVYWALAITSQREGFDQEAMEEVPICSSEAGNRTTDDVPISR
jgi:cation transporter-like permease